MINNNFVVIDKKKFLNLLDTILSHGNIAYNKYLNNGKNFLYANIIKKNNERTLELILDHAYLFCSEQRNDLLSISLHIDSWLIQWSYLHNSKNFKLDDEFVFNTTVKFPRDALRRLDNYFYEKFDQRFRN